MNRGDEPTIPPPPAAVEPVRSGDAVGTTTDERLQELMARLGHDLRAPLGAVLMWTHVARSASGAERAAALDAIEQGAREQNAIIAELVDLTRARVGRLPLARARVRQNQLVEATLASGRAAAEKRGARVERLGGGEADPELVGDPVRLVRAVSNLVLHALRFSGPGTSVSLGTPREPGWIRLEIGAEFEGYSRAALESDLSRFDFASFERGGAAAGFGLAFAREMFELHRGTLGVEEEPGAPGKTPRLTVVARLPEAAAPP
jgi:signal transduction histidine kinase